MTELSSLVASSTKSLFGFCLRFKIAVDKSSVLKNEILCLENQNKMTISSEQNTEWTNPCLGSAILKKINPS